MQISICAYLEAVAIPRAIGSRKRSLSSVACTKFAPTRPVTTTTAAVNDELAPAKEIPWKLLEDRIDVKDLSSKWRFVMLKITQ